MNWSNFITFILLTYILWYVINVLRDIFFTSQNERERTNVEHWDIKDLLKDEEEIEDVVKIEDFPLPLNTNSPTILQKENSDTITLKEPPQGEGIALHDFLKKAKKNTEEAVNNIAYN